MIYRSLLSLRNLLAPLGILALGVLSLAPPADAQCFVPDGYDSAPCCSNVTPTLPTFPASSLPGKGICWTNCALSGQVCTKISLGAPIPSTATCTQYTSILDVFDCSSGATLMKGVVTLDYTRTWNEQVPTSSLPIQVWRFAAKVDIVSPLSGTPACPVPSCALTPISTAFYYGYVDYSLDCVTGAFDTVIVLYHGCDEFTHKPGFSSVPGAYHPNSTFAIVAPDTAANPFVPGVNLPTTGVLMNEAMRSVTPNAIGTCLAEEHIQQGIFQPLVSGCLCPLSLAPPQQSGVRLSASGMCGGSFQSLNLWPAAPWYELVTTSIGRWTNTSTYPGPEKASVAEGLLLYTNICSTSGAIETSFDIFYGGFTGGGQSVITPGPGPTLTSNFLDLASNYSNLVTSPVVFPLYGTVAATDHLIYVNP
jgi:hypothetical protein